MKLILYISIILFHFTGLCQIGGTSTSAGASFPAVVNTQTIAPVFVRTVSGTNQTTASVDASTCSQVFVAFDYDKVATAVGVADNGSHTWTTLKQVEGPSNAQSGVIIYEAHGTFSASLTISTTCNTCGVSAMGFSGTTATTVDQTNGLFDNTGTLTTGPGSITTTRSHNVVIVAVYNVGGNTSSPSIPAVPSGYTDGGAFPLGTTFPGRIAYKINNSSTTTENITWTWTTLTGNLAMAIIDE